MRVRTGIASLSLLVVVTACGIRPRANVPGPNEGTIISAEEIAETGARTMWEALQRTVKYARFQESGTGTPERVRRRGASSIVLSDDMPIFVDNVRVNDVIILGSLSARDIDHIQVLNGVYATTFYGTNAGDGVVLIFTREGERVSRR